MVRPKKAPNTSKVSTHEEPSNTEPIDEWLADFQTQVAARRATAERHVEMTSEKMKASYEADFAKLPKQIREMNFYEFLRVYPDNEEVEGGGDPLEAKESEDDCADENDANHLPDESVALDETIVVKRPSAPVFKMPGTNTAAGRKRPATRASSKVLETPVGKVNVPMLIKPKLNSTVRKTRPREISYSSRGSILEPPPSFLLLDKLHKLGDKASKLELSPGTQAAIPEMRQLQEKLQNVLNQLDKK